ncbi:MAG TPA: hypothetical protein VFD39_05165 [Trueperaceae bacterium]|nr:hypothetical protein [Trueperaceae bacterium]
MTPPPVIEQHVPQDPANAFASWTAGAGLARWWWPHLPDTSYEVDGLAGLG